MNSILCLILIIIVTAVVTAAVAVFVTKRGMQRKISFMLDALEDGETAFKYSEKRFSLFHFNRTLNRLRSIFDMEMKKINEQNRYYGNMLDNISTGIVVAATDEHNAGQVLYCNAAANNLLGVPSLVNIRQLDVVSAELRKAFEEVDSNHEVRSSFYNERNRITVSLTSVKSTFNGINVRIISFTDVEHTEELSWIKLVRVLNHEIMNTITPIASLSDTLSNDVKEDKINKEDLKNGLDTISSSSQALIKFVNNYRNLTRVAVPVKKPFYVRELIEHVRQLTENQLKEASVDFSYQEKSDDVILYADFTQISQVIINLVKNAVQAEATRIAVESSINTNEQVVISVSNNGRQLSSSSCDEIFVPFYTTKQNGSGIGLSLSRQIMRLHNGSISLDRSDERITTFSLRFN